MICLAPGSLSFAHRSLTIHPSPNGKRGHVYVTSRRMGLKAGTISQAVSCQSVNAPTFAVSTFSFIVGR